MSDFMFHISDFVFHSSDLIVNISDFGFHISDFRCHISDFWFHLSDFIFHNSGFIFHISCFEFHNSYFRIRIPHFIIHISYFMFPGAGVYELCVCATATRKHNLTQLVLFRQQLPKCFPVVCHGWSLLFNRAEPRFEPQKMELCAVPGAMTQMCAPTCAYADVCVCVCVCVLAFVFVLLCVRAWGVPSPNHTAPSCKQNSASLATQAPAFAMPASAMNPWSASLSLDAASNMSLSCKMQLLALCVGDDVSKVSIIHLNTPSCKT